MASDIDICNMALGFLGDEAVVASISPPDGSVQATQCARFYPIARDSLLEMHAWGFATKRTSLALLSEAPPSTWKYVYAVPADAVNLLAIIAPDTADDYSAGLPAYGDVMGVTTSSAGVYTPQTFSSEIDGTGAQIIYTNQQNAVLRYTALVTDPTQFSPLFTETLAWLLASKLAGPILKGDTGMQAAMACLKTFNMWKAQATASDANQQRHQVAQNTDWIANR